MDGFKELFHSTILYQGKKQSDIARQVHISRSALSQFLAGTASLSQETLQKIALLIFLSQAYIESRKGNPFGSHSFHKMIIPENLVTMTLNVCLIHILMDVNNRLRVLFLSPPLSSIEKVFLPKIPIYAIAIKDGDQNIFLFRRKQKSPKRAVIVGKKELADRIEEFARKGNDFSHETKLIDDPLYLRIRSWGAVEKADIEALFEVNEEPVPEYADEEMLIISKKREYDIPASHILKCIEDIAAKREENGK